MGSPEEREPRLERVDGPDEGTIVLVLSGELDLAAGPRYRDLVQTVVDDDPTLVVVDLVDVGFMDSTMLRELLRTHRVVGEGGGRMVVAGAQPSVRRLFDLTGTSEVFAVAATRDEALASQG